MLWKISDYFVMQDPLFNRKCRQGADNIFKFLEHLIPNKLKNEGEDDKKIRLNGQTGILNISVDSEKFKVEYQRDTKMLEEFGMFLLAFTSFPDNGHMSLTRQYLSKENIDGKFVATIEPQSTAIYSTIITTESFIEKLNEDKSSTIFIHFGEKKYILFMFQIYFNSLAEADDIDKLFYNIKVIEDDNLKVEFYGLTPGLIDGFVLYSYKTDRDEILRIILDKFFSARKKDHIFYGKVYPLAVFILEAENKFLPLKRNICYLRRLFKMMH